MIDRNMTPVLKWAGGKTQLLDSIVGNMPRQYNNYYEPFVGGGAVFLAVSPGTAVLNDINEQLVNLYRQIKIGHNDILSILDSLDSHNCDKDFYYEIRMKYNRKIENRELDAECAAIMIWINKHCFNGLYRVNGKGLFNVPYNNRVGGKSADAENIVAISQYLNKNNITVECMDFEQACEGVEAGDFVYFDSPYVPESETADFTDYTKEGFSFKEHERLAELFRKLDAKGAKLMLSNNDVPLVHSLYKDYNIRSIDVKRMINRNAAKRTGREVLVTNY